MYPVWGSWESVKISEEAIICRSLPLQTIKASPELLEAVASISIHSAINAKKNSSALSDSLCFSRYEVALGGQVPSDITASFTTVFCSFKIHLFPKYLSSWQQKHPIQCWHWVIVLTCTHCVRIKELCEQQQLPPHMGPRQRCPRRQLIQSRSNTCMKHKSAVLLDTHTVQAQFKVKITSGKQRNLQSSSVLTQLMLII